MSKPGAGTKMCMPDRGFAFTMKLAALATLAVVGPARADDEAADLTKPTSSVSVGAAVISGDSKDRSLFTQYNGLRKDDAYFLLDFDYVKLDEATGTWTIVRGRNLGLETRELSA